MSSQLTAESKQYANRARDLARQVRASHEHSVPLQSVRKDWHRAASASLFLMRYLAKFRTLRLMGISGNNINILPSIAGPDPEVCSLRHRHLRSGSGPVGAEVFLQVTSASVVHQHFDSTAVPNSQHQATNIKQGQCLMVCTGDRMGNVLKSVAVCGRGRSLLRLHASGIGVLPCTAQICHTH